MDVVVLWCMPVFGGSLEMRRRVGDEISRVTVVDGISTVRVEYEDERYL